MADEIVGGPGWSGARPGMARGGFEPVGGPADPAVLGRTGAGSRRLARVALPAVVAVLFGYVVSHRPDAVAPRPDPPVPRQPAQVLAPLPEIGGRTAPGPPDLRLLVGGSTPWLVEAGAAHPAVLPGLTRRPDSVLTAFVLGGRAAGDPARVAAVAELYGSEGGRYLLRSGASPLLLGADPGVLPSRDGHLILTVHRRGDTTITGLTLRRTVRWQWELAGLGIVLRDTPHGLLVQRTVSPSSRGGDLLLLDTRSGQVVRSLGQNRVAVASTDRMVASVQPWCTARCSVRITDVVTGAGHDYRLPSEWMPERGAFSPDGSMLAMTFPTGGNGPAGPGFAATLDLRRGTMNMVWQVRTGAGLGADVGWSNDGRWLVLLVSWPSYQRIALWRPSGELIALPVTLPGRSGRLTVLP